MKDRYLAIRYIAMRLYYLGSLKNYDKEKKVNYTSINGFLGEAMDAINTFTADQIDDIFDDFCNSYETALEAWGEEAFKIKQNTPINMILFELSLLFVSLTQDINKARISLEKMKRIGLSDNKEISKDIETPFECNLKYHRDSKENFDQRISWIRKIMEENND